MKKFITALVAIAAFTIQAEDTSKKIGTAEVDRHFQESLTVTGKVAQVTIREKLVYLNLDKPYPNTPLTGIIFSRMTNQFGDLPSLKGKSVELTGRIEDHNGKLQIVINSTNQLKVVSPHGSEQP